MIERARTTCQLTLKSDRSQTIIQLIKRGTSLAVTMSALPLSLKKEGLVERHQVEGNDPSDRYFNRSALVNRTSGGYLAKVTYEALTVEGQAYTSVSAAVKSLVDKLRELGFRRLRTRPNFKGRRYLAEKETWVDYPDPQ